jgi:hypothetical protein
METKEPVIYKGIEIKYNKKKNHFFISFEKNGRWRSKTFPWQTVARAWIDKNI